MSLIGVALPLVLPQHLCPYPPIGQFTSLSLIGIALPIVLLQNLFTYPCNIVRDGRASFLWTFAFPPAHVPRFFLRIPCSRVPVRHFFVVSCALAFLFCVPMLLGQHVYVYVCGVGVQLITCALCVYGRIRQAG